MVRLEYSKRFKQVVSVDVKASPDPNCVIFEHAGKSEKLVNPFADVEDRKFEPDSNIGERAMLILKFLWLYQNRRSHRVKQCFDDADEAWAPGLDDDAKLEAQVRLDHNDAAWHRLHLNKRGIIEELWLSARDQLPPPAEENEA